MSVVKKYWDILRRIRILHVLNNIVNYRILKKNRALYQKYNIPKTVVGSISHQDIKAVTTEKPWLDDANAGERLNNSADLKEFEEGIRKQLLQWPEKGYAVLDHFVKPEFVDQVNADLELLIKKGEIAYDYTNTRVMNLYRHSAAAKKIVTDEKLLKILSFILGKKVVPFQSINFVYGSQQRTHSDSIHMTTHPLGYLVAIWVALEDLEPGCGLLHYYPGSQKLPYVMGEDFENSNTSLMVGNDFYANYEKKIGEIITKQNLKKEVFAAKKGDLFIWHANLLHGGEPRTNPTATRKSLVAHYFCEGDVINYHEITQRPAVIKNV
jgi:ectoine hydroxylase